MAGRNLAIIALCAVCLGTTARPQPARADSMSLDLDPAQSTVRFTLGALLHGVHGTFALKQGALWFDPATGHASGAIVVDLTTGQSGDAKRDSTMREDVLQVDVYPLAVFTPTRIQGHLADGTASVLDVDGMMAIHGATHPMMLHVTVDPKGATMSATTRFSVPYVQWGMKDPSTFLLRVGKTVDIDLTAVGHIHLATGGESPQP